MVLLRGWLHLDRNLLVWGFDLPPSSRIHHRPSSRAERGDLEVIVPSECNITSGLPRLWLAGDENKGGRGGDGVEWG